MIAATAGAPPLRAPTELHGITVAEMGLTIGMSLGVRQQLGGGRAMHSSRVIGFAPNRELFVTTPVSEGQPIPLMRGEQVEAVAISQRAVFWFVCTVDALCKDPFHYVVLSEPGLIRRVRERKAVRVPVHLPVHYSVPSADGDAHGLGFARNLSAHGMTLAAHRRLGDLGDRLSVAFSTRTDDAEVEIRTDAVIRNVQVGATPREVNAHGLEFDQLGASPQRALKLLVLELHARM